jgi:uncharacterized protein (DUF1778 family)
VYTPSISIRLSEEALDLINRARQLEHIDESLSSFMVSAADTQADAIMGKYRREKKKNAAYARVPVFPDFAGPFPNGGDKKMVHIGISDEKKKKFRKVAVMLNQNNTQFIVLASVLRSLKILHRQQKRCSKPTTAA